MARAGGDDRVWDVAVLGYGLLLAVEVRMEKTTKRWTHKHGIPFGAVLRDQLKDDDPKTEVGGLIGWTFARPLPYDTFPSRLRRAWDVWCQRADALYWTQQ